MQNNNLLGEIPLQQLKEVLAIREKIQNLQKELSSIVGGRPSPTKAAAPQKKKRRFSAAARAKLSAAMKDRWTRRKGKGRGTKAAAAKGTRLSSGTPMKERIVRTLKAAGKSGVTVKDLAAKLGKSYGNVSVWFHTTGKGMKEIKKVEPGRFAWGA